MRAWAACAFSTAYVTPWLAPRAGSVVRSCAAKANTIGEHGEGEETARHQSQPSPPVLLRDIFSPKQSGEWSGAGKKRALDRLDRLQEVANLALADRGAPGGEPWGCADIGADHGLLAICLHANGANVIAGDRAAGPLGVARENFRLYLRRALDLSSAVAVPMGEGAPSIRNETTGALGAYDEVCMGRDQGVLGDGVDGEEEPGGAADLPRLECRLGDGLAVLKEDDVDTVCIAGVGVKTMIQILGANDGCGNAETVGEDIANEAMLNASLLSHLGVRRLVLQPMDARLEYMRDLRVWLRKHGWRITQETIVSTSGKGGNRAFLTLRADEWDSVDDLESDQRLPSWQSDWLGRMLPARATGLRGEQQGKDRQEASTFLAYLRHQRDWLRAIERARAPGEGYGESSGNQHAAISEVVDEVVVAVEDALRSSGGGAEDVDTARPLVTAKRWRRLVG
eukprot:g12785.t1